ncbi:MauE/DoxX family redox-associated membrane protein [Chryseobacterium koreense]|uniref:MauE/DoxX family redox-associated membrane protein n=1 Tax=Chryseobacterium koreense TaxID=232216 RepID=UPI0026F344B5|nr:MauE/DoxX family redox-associated membrane protein [Chryseobacterium koreense]
MKILTKIIPLAVSFFFILLFIYAAASKMLDFENFQVQLAQSPLLSAYAGLISYAVIILEIVVAGLLCFQVTRLIGLYASFALMVAFTVYIYLILHFSDFVPCSCGGILEKMSWQQHLVFNIISVLLAFIGISFIRKDRAHRWSHTAARLAFAAALSAGSMVALFLSSEYIIKKENNFTRRFLPNFLAESPKFILNREGYYFAGASTKTIYLGNRFTPLIFTEIDLATRAVKHNRIYGDFGRYTFKNLKVKVKAPYYYLYDGTVPIIYWGRLGNNAPKAIGHNDAYFSQLAVIDSLQFALRTQSSTTHMFTLGILDLSKEPRLKLFPDAISKEIDGIFDADGQLTDHQSEMPQATYIYLYRNQFITLNGKLGTFTRQKTIGNSKISLQITKLANGKHTMSAPPVKVNSKVAAYGNFILVLSEIRGKFEPLNLHKNRSTIDVYDHLKNEYSGSFYVPEKNIEEIAVTRDFLFVLSGKTISQYKFRKVFLSGEAENLYKE